MLDDKFMKLFLKRFSKELGSEDNALSVMFGLSVVYRHRKDYEQLLYGFREKIKSGVCRKQYDQLFIAPHERRKQKAA